MSEAIMANTQIKVCAKIEDDGTVADKLEKDSKLPFWIITLPVTLGGLIVLCLSLAVFL